MPLIGIYVLGQTVPVDLDVHDPATQGEVDATGTPTFRCYEEQSDATVATGNFSKRDDGNTVGAYKAEITLNPTSGFEVNKTYKVRKRAVVGSIAGSWTDTFQIVPDVVDSDGVVVTDFTTAAKAILQTEAADALAAYDPPTNAEMVARTLAAADYATAAALGTVDGIVDLILADTAELQTDWVNGGRLDLLIDAIKASTDPLPSDPADQSLLVAATTAIYDRIGAPAGDSIAADIATRASASAMGVVDGIVDDIKLVTEKLDDTLELQSGVYRFTEEALAEGPSGGGGGGGGDGATPEEVKAAVVEALTEQVYAEPTGALATNESVIRLLGRVTSLLTNDRRTDGTAVIWKNRAGGSDFLTSTIDRTTLGTLRYHTPVPV